MNGAASERLAALTERYGLPRPAYDQLRRLVDRLASDPLAPTTIRDPEAIVDQHVADSLVSLELEPVQQAQLALDLGSGAGLPGLPLAVALPDAMFVLLESVARKCEFIAQTAEACAIGNVRVLNDRAESYEDGRRRHDLVTARAVARLDVNAEYAAPLLRIGGTLVAWGGRRSEEAEGAARVAAAQLGLGDLSVTHVSPFPNARHRHLYVMSKVMETPDRFPRRPGMAAKRPLGATPGKRASSDRASR